MRVTVLSDNTVHQAGLQSDWGFSCLVETLEEGRAPILFDTGMKGSILLANMEKLGIDPMSVKEVFISHAHFDHVGGLSAFLTLNKEVTIYVLHSIRGVQGINKVVSVIGPLEIHENVFLTGELDSIEQSMAIKTEKGVVLITGCSHPGLARILAAASQFGKVYAVIGGLHGFSEYELFKDLSLICALHCTQHQRELKALYPKKHIDGGAGKIIVI
ncbi:MAG: MBL fold metallo-hydrolase [Deltaproteobacteria bacterium]|nr:MAG: MBL fold metallo-hydrolase [Deltaproteobacteria bacterium]